MSFSKLKAPFEQVLGDKYSVVFRRFSIFYPLRKDDSTPVSQNYHRILVISDFFLYFQQQVTFSQSVSKAANVCPTSRPRNRVNK